MADLISPVRSYRRSMGLRISQPSNIPEGISNATKCIFSTLTVLDQPNCVWLASHSLKYNYCIWSGVHSKIFIDLKGEGNKSSTLVVEKAQSGDEEGNHKKQFTQNSPEPSPWPASHQPPPQAYGLLSVSETSMVIAFGTWCTAPKYHQLCKTHLAPVQ